MQCCTSVIHISDLHTWKEDDLSIMKKLVEQHNVPLEHRFLLLTSVRYAHAFRLLEFAGCTARYPEYTNELLKLVKSEDTISLTIRTLAMHALGSQLAAASAVSSLNNTIDPSSIEFNEALLQFYLLQLPGSIIRGSGMILTFLPLLENADPPHMI
ncbi:hypothetical protein Tco_1090495 [Tanacetum coccineum]|uniref:Uncharacterized protein n=1 Tax=Tanacetum coccineum TaxID=301880 RepID=A0ABQ5I613_9ASTR